MTTEAVAVKSWLMEFRFPHLAETPRIGGRRKRLALRPDHFLPGKKSKHSGSKCTSQFHGPSGRGTGVGELARQAFMNSLRDARQPAALVAKTGQSTWPVAGYIQSSRMRLIPGSRAMLKACQQRDAGAEVGSEEAWCDGALFEPRSPRSQFGANLQSQHSASNRHGGHFY